MPWLPAAPLEAVPADRPLGVDVGGETLLLVRDGPDVRAVDGLCPHKFGPLAQGTVVGSMLSCPIHAATFDLRTGHAQPGSIAMGALTVYPTRVVGGTVEVLVG